MSASMLDDGHQMIALAESDAIHNVNMALLAEGEQPSPSITMNMTLLTEGTTINLMY